MKKMLFAILAVLAAATFTACGEQKKTENAKADESKQKAITKSESDNDEKFTVTREELRLVKIAAIMEKSTKRWMKKTAKKDKEGNKIFPTEDEDGIESVAKMNNTPEERERNTQEMFEKEEIVAFAKYFKREIRYNNKQEWYEDIKRMPEVMTKTVLDMFPEKINDNDLDVFLKDTKKQEKAKMLKTIVF